jgi:hypothetical protein
MSVRHVAQTKQTRSGPDRYRLVALAAVLAFLILIAVSGPHLVHHLAEQSRAVAYRWHAQPDDGHPTHPEPTPEAEAHHAEAHPHPPRDGQAQEKKAHPWPDCLVLFLLQHTPVAASALAFGACLLVVILLESAGRIWLSTDRRLGFHARAPPA